MNRSGDSATLEVIDRIVFKDVAGDCSDCCHCSDRKSARCGQQCVVKISGVGQYAGKCVGDKEARTQHPTQYKIVGTVLGKYRNGVSVPTSRLSSTRFLSSSATIRGTLSNTMHWLRLLHNFGSQCCTCRRAELA